MKSVYLVSYGSRSGKTILSIGLALNCPGRVGFFKPYRDDEINIDGKVYDADAALIKHFIGGNIDSMSPFVFDMSNPVSMDDIVSKYNEASEGNEYMILEGSREYQTGASNGASYIEIAKKLKVPIIIVTSGTPESVDMILHVKRVLELEKLELKGVVLNKENDTMEKKLLESKGVKVIGVVPAIPQLASFHVSEVLRAIPSKVVAGEKGLDKIGEEIMVGAMTSQIAVRYMRTNKQKVVITGGDRTEVMLAALSTNTVGIVATGNIKPSRSVLLTADEKNIPIILTELNTLEASEMMDMFVSSIHTSDREKIDLIKRSISKSVDMKHIWD